MNGLNESFDLPTEFKWEHASLCGHDATWSWGNEDDKLEEFAWYKDNSRGRVHESGKKRSNNWGLYDMYGNIYEYTRDSVFELHKSKIIDPGFLPISVGQPLPIIGGCYESSIKEILDYRILGFSNQYIEPVGFRLILRDVNIPNL